jgi:hypothetical protein
MLIDLPAGGETLRVPGNPVKLSGMGSIPTSPPPALGEHTEVVRATGLPRGGP